MMVKFSDDVGLAEEAIDTAADENEYFYIGRMIAVSIVNGGPGPCCLSPNFFMYLVGKDKTFEAPIDDIPDEEIKKALLEIKNATSLSELRVITEKHSSMLQTAGCYRFMRTLEDKKKVVADYIQWNFIYQNHLSIQSFREGLATLDFLNTLELVAADHVENIFHVQFGPPGSSRRQEETRVLSYWQDYLLSVEERNGSLSLEDILMFATGLREIPPAAIQPKPRLLFQTTSRFPVADVSNRLDEAEERIEKAEERIQNTEDAMIEIIKLQIRLEDKLIDLESRTRRENIRIYGVPETAEQDFTIMIEFVEKLLRDGLGLSLSQEDIERAHRSQGPLPPPGDAPPRFKTKEFVLRKAWQKRGFTFSGRHVSLDHDYSFKKTKRICRGAQMFERAADSLPDSLPSPA
ncbi:hypothetical protein ACER0C_002467 [Sarotherodon galilaeus]